MKILLVGISTRALAQSAAAAGYELISLDFFGDSDQPPTAEVHSLVRDLGLPPELAALAEAARLFVPRAERVVVEAGLENEPALLKLCPEEKRWGNSSETVTRVRDLDQVRTVLLGTGMRLPEVIGPGQALPAHGHYLVKNLTHSGGLGVREWDGHTPPRDQEILQRFVEGELASACFVSDGQEVQLLGLSRQFAGVPELGAPAFTWCGNVAPWGNLELETTVLKTIKVLTRSFGLVGLNGIDFKVQDGVPFLLEVNPRPPASFELYERLRGVNAFQLHVDSCQKKLPAALPPVPSDLAWGKGIVYTRSDLLVGDTHSWAAQDISDIPHPGEQIPGGGPVCTIFAHGKDAAEAWVNVLAKVSRRFPDLHRQPTNAPPD